MKCETSYGWLLATRGGVPLPARVQRHLDRCRACRRRRQRLLRLEQGLQNVPVPPADPTALDRLLHRLETTPGPTPTRRPAARPTRSLRVWQPAIWAAAAAAVLLITTVLWLLPGRHRNPELAQGPVPPAEGLVARLLEADLRLAETFAPAEQLAVLADMATGLRDEAIRVARLGEVAELSALSGLHGRVVRHGVVGRARALSPKDKEALKPVVRQLRETAGAAGQTAAEVAPEAAPPLQEMQTAANDVLAVLEGGRPVAAAGPDPGANGSDLRSVLVMQGLRLAEEEDPLRRAECCADLSDHLVRVVLAASQSSETEVAEWYGQQLGSVLDRGVATNLARVKVNEDAPAEVAEFRRACERGTRATAVLEEKLREAPPEAREGLERALEASRPAEHAKKGEKPDPVKKGKGPGKPGGPPGQGGPPGHKPPGLQKKPGKGPDRPAP